MMRRSFFLRLSITAVCGQLLFHAEAGLHAQEFKGTLTVSYNLQLNQMPALECEPELWFSNGTSVFYWHDNEQESKLESEPGFLRLELRDTDPVGTINSLDYNTKQLTTRGSLFQEPYLLQESMPELHWKLTQGSKRLGGLQVYEAKTTFRGRNYTAWYYPEIPLPIGPWKLQGLPGVILEAYDDEGFFRTVFTSIIRGESTGNTPDLGFLPAREINMAEFFTQQQEIANELVRRIRAKLPRGADISVQHTVSEFLERNFENP